MKDEHIGVANGGDGQCANSERTGWMTCGLNSCLDIDVSVKPADIILVSQMLHKQGHTKQTDVPSVIKGVGFSVFVSDFNQR